MQTCKNGYWAATDNVLAVVPVENGDYHGVSSNRVARNRALAKSLPGFWRLKERKA